MIGECVDNLAERCQVRLAIKQSPSPVDLEVILPSSLAETSLCHHYHGDPPQLYQFVLGTVSPRVEKVKVHPLAADRLESLPTSAPLSA